MAARIHRLSDSLVRKIAAGEVIERPASVVKELVENALDAGARHVQVNLIEAGRHAIRVVDDGCGMSQEDTELCVERHATSKMSSPTDLFAIDTLGFRGEALATIGAVSRLVVESRSVEAEAGTRIVVEGGVRRELTAVARDVGTSVEVGGLFFNTPARRKFLRHADTEMRYLTQSVVQLAAGHPDVAFRLYHEDRLVLDLLPGNRRARAGQLLGADPDDLLSALAVAPVAGAPATAAAPSVEALITPPDLCRRSRAKQFVVVRGRPILSRPIVSAVYAGYGSILPHDAHPQFVLWFDLDPRQVDVNVHPTKREVRFADEASVRRVVQDAVRRAVAVPEARRFAARGESYACRVAEAAVPATERYGTTPAASGISIPSIAGRKGEGVGDEFGQMSLSLLPPASLAGRILGADAEGQTALEEASRSQKVWQVHEKYLLVQVQDGLLVVDQHVAHERVRYEEVLADLETERGVQQQLLMPLTVDVNPAEMEGFRESRDLFERLGFSAREFGPSTLLIEAVPPELRDWEDGDPFYQILSDLLEELEARSEAREALAASMACHTSIRAGERLSSPQMVALLEGLLGAREPFACPHGRPILAKIPIAELDRLFLRT